MKNARLAMMKKVMMVLPLSVSLMSASLFISGCQKSETQSSNQASAEHHDDGLKSSSEPVAMSAEPAEPNEILVANDIDNAEIHKEDEHLEGDNLEVEPIQEDGIDADTNEAETVNTH